MIIELLAIFLIIIVSALPFCLYPILIAIAVNKSNEIIDKKQDSEV